MKSLFNIALLGMVLSGVPGALFAQWPDYPTPGVPKGPDGKPDLTGPVPRTADGHPDLSGMWDLARPPRPAPKDGSIPGQLPLSPPAAAPGTPPPAPPAGGIGLGPRPPGVSQFFDIGSTLKDGLPMTPWAKEIRAQRKGENNKDNPDAHCLPLGLMQLHLHPQPRKIIQTPKLIVILYEAQGGVRQIFMDGRPLPKDDPQPWWYGYSIGHWDGDTLVVETTGFRDDVWLDVEGSPLTNTGKMTERFRRVNYGNLEIEVTVEDPKAYTKPWTVMIKQRVMLNTDLIEFICNENEKSDAHLVGK
ncbi:MAG TPA: hypothetical protein VK724_01030 [Bryobacteraceae bacterium]|nr:hypothetical protein [Bryobacteraceae bacterium]